MDHPSHRPHPKWIPPEKMTEHTPALRPKPHLTITPAGSNGGYWGDLWRFRELLGFLVWRDLLVRYKQTVIGVVWTVARPLATIVAFTMVFGKLANLPSSGVPYPLLVLTGVLPWQFFSQAFSDCGNSLVANAHVISKVYFPRLIVPISTILVCLSDHLILCGFLSLVLVWFAHSTRLADHLLAGDDRLDRTHGGRLRLHRGIDQCAVSRRAPSDPVRIAAWRLHFAGRLRHIDRACQMAAAVCVQPRRGLVDGYRWCILGTTDLIYPPSILITVAFAAATLVLGIRLFRRLEATFADVI